MQQKERSMRECRNRAAPLYRVVYICIQLKKNALMPGLTRQFGTSHRQHGHTWDPIGGITPLENMYVSIHPINRLHHLWYISTYFILSLHFFASILLFTKILVPDKKALVFLFLMALDINFTLSFHTSLLPHILTPLQPIIYSLYSKPKRNEEEYRTGRLYTSYFHMWLFF